MADFTHGAVAHFDIAGGDADVLGAFYSGLFGWSVDPKGPGYALIETGANSPNGAIVETEAPALTMGVAVKSLAETIAKAEAAGGRVVMPATDNGWVKKAQIADPSGNVVTLIEL